MSTDQEPVRSVCYLGGYILRNAKSEAEAVQRLRELLDGALGSDHEAQISLTWNQGMPDRRASISLQGCDDIEFVALGS